MKFNEERVALLMLLLAVPPAPVKRMFLSVVTLGLKPLFGWTSWTERANEPA